MKEVKNIGTNFQVKTGNRIILFTGDGKGKTTAALGMALRAGGQGIKSLVLQFVKAGGATGELTACRGLAGMEIVQVGRGFIPDRGQEDYPEHCRAAREGLIQAEQALSSGNYGLVVLDEICVAVDRGLLTEAMVIKAIGRASPGVCVVLTGRNAAPGLMALADTVTEMRLVKHGLTAGWPAQQGVEY